MGKVSIRAAGVAGIIFVLLVAIPGFLAGTPPDPGDPAASFVSYVQDHRSAVLATVFLAAAGNFFVAFFLGGLVTAFRRLGGSVTLIVAALTSLLITGAIATAGGLFMAAAAFRLGGAQHVDAESVRLLSDASSISFTVIGFPLAAFLVASGAVMASVRQFPTWLGWFAWLGAVLEVIGTIGLFSTSGAFAPGGSLGLVFGLLPFGLFVLATGAIMVARGDAMERAPSG